MVQKKLHTCLFDMSTVSHVFHGLWRHPRNNRHRFNEMAFWTELATLAEQGLMDMVFMADVCGIYDYFRDSDDVALSEAMQIPTNEPMLLISAMAAVTKHVGFGVTFSTTYEHPFSFARRMSTLDHITEGRIGWNIVTSYLRNAAASFGLDQEIEHDRRYELADEFATVAYKLWEGSWGDDAVVRDVAKSIYIDPAKVRRINHVGARYKVAGPHLCEPSPQRTPLLIQATGSGAGLAFAARHAELLFTVGRTPEAARAAIIGAKKSLAEVGRDPNSVKFVIPACVIVAKTQEVAEAKYNELRNMGRVEGYLAHLQSGVDLTQYPLDTPIAAITAEKPHGWHTVPIIAGDAKTVGEAIQWLKSFNIGSLLTVGTPQSVADDIEFWMDECGVDGINLVQQLSFDTLTDFVELVVPELQRRGRYRTEYVPGETLRERFFGAGRRRLPESHFAARFRDPSNLKNPPEPFRYLG